MRATITGHEPREWCGPLGCNPVLMPAGISHDFEFLDADTLVLREPGCTGDTCEVVYYRSR